MSEGARMPYDQAKTKAELLRVLLLPVCQRVEIAGSLRRGKPTIGDIELVLIPRDDHDLFDNPIFGAGLVENVLREAKFSLTKNGDYFKQTTFQGIGVDIFLTTPEKWGCVFTIRTGSADFTRWLVTARNQGGACPSNMRFMDGRIWRGNEALKTPEEADVFQALRLDYIEPSLRTDGVNWANVCRMGRMA